MILEHIFGFALVTLMFLIFPVALLYLFFSATCLASKAICLLFLFLNVVLIGDFFLWMKQKK